MADFPIEYAQGVPQVVQMPRASMNVDTGAGAIGEAISGAGRAAYSVIDKITTAENALELSNAKRTLDEFGYAANKALQSAHTDEERKAIQDKWSQDVSSVTSKRKAVEDDIILYKNSTIPQWNNNFSNVIESVRKRDVKSDFDLNYQDMLSRGDFRNAYALLDMALSTDVITPAESQRFKKDIVSDSLISQAERLANMGDAGSMVAARNILANIQTDEETKKDLTLQQLEQIKRLTKITTEKNETLQEEAHKQLSDLMASNQLTVGQVQARRNALSAEDYEQWTKIAVSPAAKPGNTIAETALKSSAMDIWRGTITRKEFDNMVRTSLADPNGINDKQYAAIMADADKELKQTQAEDIRRFSKDAANVILGQYSGLLQFDAMGNLTGVNMAGLSGDQTEDLKYRMHFHSLYEQGLRDFIADHPDASGRDFYLFAREQKMRYWNTSLEQMKAIAKELPPVAPGTPLDVDTARLLLQQSGGNRGQAEQKARDLGYSF